MRTLLTIARFLIPLILAGSAAGSAGAAEPCQRSTPGYFHKYLSGKIDGRHAFKMDLTCRDGALRGNYRYANQDMPISLMGTVEPDATVMIKEIAANGEASTGSFTGTIRGAHVDGVWTSGNGKRRLPFTAEQTSEIHLGSRREIVSKTVGDYGLVSITGYGGANAMWETWKLKNRWESSVSSISAGRRESSVIKLTTADKRLLDSLTVTVRADLRTELIARGRVVLTIPFSDSGAQFNITSAENARVRESLEKLWAEADMQDETLYLLAQDDVDFSRAVAGNFDGGLGSVVLVSYSIADDSFGIDFTIGECCNSTRFTFERDQRSKQKR